MNPPIEDYAVSGLLRQDKSCKFPESGLFYWKMAKADPVSKYLAEIGRRGGKARVPKGAAALTPAERKSFAQKGAAARWGKKATAKVKKPPK